jgi:glycosyltransferase involved in cell wall biosynthesis
MRLGLVLDQIVYDHHGRYSTDEAFIRFVEAATAPLFDRIEFCSRVMQATADAPYQLAPERYTIRPLPWYPDIAELCLASPVLLPRIAQRLSGWLPAWDMAMVCGVHPISALTLRLARHRRVPAQLWIRGDTIADVECKYSGVRRLAGLAVAGLTTACIPADTPVVSIGRDDYPLLARMGRLHVAFDSKFGDEDIAPGPRTPCVDAGAFRILYVGRISSEKGVGVLIEAMQRLVARRPACITLTLVGSDFLGSPYGDAFRARVAEAGLAGAVTMTGYVPYGPALWQIYDAHDALVLPSFTEGFPQVILEAMARGIPVVATTVGGVPRLVRDGENGLLIPPGRPDALADAVVRLADDSGLRTRLSRAGLACAAAHARGAEVASIAAFTASCLNEAA